MRTLRTELCDHLLILNEAHARHVLVEYQQHYNTTDRTKPDTNNHPNLVHIPTEHREPTPAYCYVPASSMDSSTNTDTRLDLQR
jgi:hypothetical protein